LHAVDVSADSDSADFMYRIYATVDTNATTTAEYEDFLARSALICVGNDIDLGERLLLETLRSQNPWLAKANESREGPQTIGAIESGRHPLVILVGGPAQNNVTAFAAENGWFNYTRTLEGGIIASSGKLPGGTVVVAVSDRQGNRTGGIRNEAASRSPLAALMPKEYVPLAATGISLLMLILVNVGRTVFEFKALDFGRKGRKVGEGAWTVSGFNISEMLAIAGASMVLGLSISWQFFAPSKDFLFWLAINSMICLFAAILHEVTHRIFAHIFNIRMEYRFWPAGSALTLLSSFLGNAFSIQGFILEEIPAGVPKWKVGLMKLASPLLSATVMVIFAWMYFLDPDPIYKVVYSTSALWAMAEILPFGALDGKDIRDWSHTVWFIAFSLITVSYLAVTFLL